ncbi:MAG TPA: hypothetical protein DEH78_21235, partial [Solibacterales bacterium]|nr:hypothetical protein [Bryobacterales bacterium]
MSLLQKLRLLSIGQKLGLCVSALGILIALVGGSSLYSVRKVHSSLSLAMDESHLTSSAVAGMRVGLGDLERHVSTVQFNYTVTYLAKFDKKTEAAIGQCSGCHVFQGAADELKAFDTAVNGTRSHAASL